MTDNQQRAESLITQAMHDWVGAESPPLTSPPIYESDIRRAAIAIYWPEVPPRLYWDEDYARTTSWQGIIAPEEMNPFTWMVGRAHIGPQPDRIDQAQEALEAARVIRPPGAPPRYLFGGIDSSYRAPMRPGDAITSVIKATDLYERKGRAGMMLFYITEERWTNQHGDLIKTTRTTNIQF